MVTEHLKPKSIWFKKILYKNVVLRTLSVYTFGAKALRVKCLKVKLYGEGSFKAYNLVVDPPLEGDLKLVRYHHNQGIGWGFR